MLLSSDVALQIGQQQSMFAMQGQHADMVTDSIRRSNDPQYGSPALGGKAFNAIGAIGAPLGGLALGLAGMDPASLGMRAFGASRAVGMGFGAAAGAGLGAFGVGTAGMMAASYFANQIQQGGAQQQQFTMGMQRSFNFMTPTGQGFNNSQLGAMGGQLRQMSGQIGPHGQMTGFDELSSLAQNMGKMGLTSGTQDVTSFTTNFRKMLQTVKHIATELGGSLQEAQQVMAGMRNSGVFRNADQGRMASEIRNFSIGGNVSTGDLTQAAGFGSQISRAIGGRGAAGAFAGVRTRGEVGLAVQSGVLNDEDIYNATGMRGAEGQQAYAAAQMQGAAAWLRGGRGRRFVASLAGADGQLDANSVRDWQNGNMGTGRTMANAHRNLDGVGRADFIRNEGRLRGEALAAFGGNLPAMALQQWAESKGVDIHNMDDRSMLFAQRQLGMDRDMVDNAVKMLDGMPAMMRQQRFAARSDSMRTELAAHKRTSGLEGAKRKMEAAREHVQNKLQGTGQQLYTDLVNGIDSWLQEQSGHIAQQATQEIDRAYEGLTKGQGGSLAKTLFGTGGGTKSVVPGVMGTNRSVGTTGGMTVDLFNKGSLFGTSMNDKMKAAGYNLGDPTSTRLLQDAIKGATAFSQGAQMGNDTAATELGGKYAGLLSRLYGGELGETKGAARYDALRAALEKEQKGGSKDAGDLLKELSGRAALTDVKGNRQQANRLASLEAGAGIDADRRIGANSALPAGTNLIGSGMTDAERVRHYGGGGGSYLDALGEGAAAAAGLSADGGLLKRLGSWEGTAKKALSAIGIITTGGIANMAVGAATTFAGTMKAADKNRAADAEGQRLISLKGLQESEGILEGRDMTGAIKDRMSGLDTHSAEYSVAQKALKLNELTMRAKAGEKIDWKTKENDDLHNMARRMGDALEGQRMVNRKAAAAMGRMDSEKQLGGLANLGIVDAEGNISDSFSAKLSDSQHDIVRRHMDVLKHQRKGGAEEKDMNKLNDLGRIDQRGILGASDQELRGLQDVFSKSGDFGMASLYGQALSDKKSADRAVALGNVGVASALGIKLTRKQMYDLQNMKAGDAGIAHALGQGLGVDMGASEEKRGKIDKDLADLEAAHEAAAGTDSLSDYQDKKRMLEKQKAASVGDERLAGMIKDVANAKDPAERSRKLRELQQDPEYQKKQEENQKKRQEQDPTVSHLSKIAEATMEMKKALVDLPANLAKVMPGGDAPGSHTPAGPGAPKK